MPTEIDPTLTPLEIPAPTTPPLHGGQSQKMEALMVQLKQMEIQAVAQSHLALQEAIQKLQTLTQSAGVDLSEIQRMKNELGETLARAKAKEEEAPPPPVVVNTEIVTPPAPGPKAKPKRPRWL